MRILFLFAILLLTSPAVSQELSPSQTAIQIDNIINSWALRLIELQEQNAQLKARVKELEDKYEPKPVGKS